MGHSQAKPRERVPKDLQRRRPQRLARHTARNGTEIFDGKFHGATIPACDVLEDLVWHSESFIYICLSERFKEMGKSEKLGMDVGRVPVWHPHRVLSR